MTISLADYITYTPAVYTAPTEINRAVIAHCIADYAATPVREVPRAKPTILELLQSYIRQ